MKGRQLAKAGFALLHCKRPQRSVDTPGLTLSVALEYVSRMSSKPTSSLLLILLALVGCKDPAPTTRSAPASPLHAGAIGAAAGTTANTTDEGIVRVTWARSDVPVHVDGMSFPVAAGLTSWAGFAPTPTGTMLMGDTVVFQDEVSPAMDAAFAHGLEITALHNHFLYDEPRVYFMHIGGYMATRCNSRAALEPCGTQFATFAVGLLCRHVRFQVQHQRPARSMQRDDRPHHRPGNGRQGRRRRQGRHW